VGRRVVESEEALDEEAAARFLRRAEVRLLPAADPPYHPLVEHMLTIRAEVQRRRRTFENAGVSAVEQAIDVRGLLVAEGLERIVADVEA
jgi:hypothetical protein